MHSLHYHNKFSVLAHSQECNSAMVLESRTFFFAASTAQQKSAYQSYYGLCLQCFTTLLQSLVSLNDVQVKAGACFTQVGSLWILHIDSVGRWLTSLINHTLLAAYGTSFGVSGNCWASDCLGCAKATSHILSASCATAG